MNIGELGLGGDYPPLNNLLKNLPKIEENNPANEKFKIQPDSGPLNIGRSQSGFADTLKEFIGEINELQIESGQKTDKFIKGEPIELHDVMIASNKAKTSFQLLLELRNKGLDLYREISRMQ